MDIPLSVLHTFLQFYEQHAAKGSLDYAAFISAENERLQRLQTGEQAASLPVSLDRMLGYYLQRVGRLAQMTGKRALINTPLSKIEEFVVLNTVYLRAPLTKSEVNRIAVLEATTGSQLIRRLVDLGLLLEKENEKDRRSILLHVTEEGSVLRNQIFETMGYEMEIKFAPLEDGQKNYLLKMLNILNVHLEQIAYNEDPEK